MNCDCTITTDPKMPGRICDLHFAHIAAAVAAEREACAKIADGYRHDESRDGTLYRDDDCAADGTAFDIAAAIRARGET